LPGDRPPDDDSGPREFLLSGRSQTGDRGAAILVSLDREADRNVGSIEQQTADLRRRVAYWIIGTFIGTNLVTVIALGILAWLDQSNIQAKLMMPGDRIITSQTFMALLGATTVQVGAIMVIIARYLFPGRPS
jgi:hypothetical protein